MKSDCKGCRHMPGSEDCGSCGLDFDFDNWEPTAKIKFVNHKKLIERGNAEISFILNSAQQGIILWLFIRDLFAIPGSWVIGFFPAAMVLKLGISWFFGKVWDKKRLIAEEAQWSAERNPYLVEMLDILKGLRDKERKEES